MKVLARSASGANRSSMRRRDPAIKQTRDRRRRLAPREIKTQNIGLHPSLLSDGPPNQKAIQQDGQYKKRAAQQEIGHESVDGSR